MIDFRICLIKPSGALDITPISPETAIKRDYDAFLAFVIECQKALQKHQNKQLHLFSLEQK